MKRVLTFLNGKKKWLTAQEIYDNIDTTGYEVVLNQDTWSGTSNINSSGFSGSMNDNQYEEVIYCFFIFDNLGDFDYYECVAPHSVVSRSAFAQREIRTNSNLLEKNLFDSLSMYCHGGSDYEPPAKGGTLSWNTTTPENCKWVLFRKTIDSNIRFQNITQKNNSFAFLPRKIPLCMNITDFTVGTGEFEKLYQYNHILNLKEL